MIYLDESVVFLLKKDYYCFFLFSHQNKIFQPTKQIIKVSKQGPVTRNNVLLLWHAVCQPDTTDVLVLPVY